MTHLWPKYELLAGPQHWSMLANTAVLVTDAVNSYDMFRTPNCPELIEKLRGNYRDGPRYASILYMAPKMKATYVPTWKDHTL